MKLVVNDIGGNDDGVILYRGLDDPRDEFAGESLHEGIEREVEQRKYTVIMEILLTHFNISPLNINLLLFVFDASIFQLGTSAGQYISFLIS